MILGSMRNEDFLPHTDICYMSPQIAQLEFSLITQFNKIVAWSSVNKNTYTHTHMLTHLINSFQHQYNPNSYLENNSFCVGFFHFYMEPFGYSAPWCIKYLLFKSFHMISVLFFIPGPFGDFLDQKNKLLQKSIISPLPSRKFFII